MSKLVRIEKLLDLRLQLPHSILGLRQTDLRMGKTLLSQVRVFVEAPQVLARYLYFRFSLTANALGTGRCRM